MCTADIVTTKFICLSRVLEYPCILGRGRYTSDHVGIVRTLVSEDPHRHVRLFSYTNKIARGSIILDVNHTFPLLRMISSENC